MGDIFPKCSIDTSGLLTEAPVAVDFKGEDDIPAADFLGEVFRDLRDGELFLA